MLQVITTRMAPNPAHDIDPTLDELAEMVVDILRAEPLKTEQILARLRARGFTIRTDEDLVRVKEALQKVSRMQRLPDIRFRLLTKFSSR